METGATKWMALPPWLFTINHNLFQVVFEHEFAQKHGKAFWFPGIREHPLGALVIAHTESFFCALSLMYTSF